MKQKLETPEEINRLLYSYSKVHRSYGSMKEMGEDQVREYRRQGFLAADNVLGEAEITGAVQALMDNLFAEKSAFKIQYTKPRETLSTNQEKELAVRKIYEFVEHSEALRAIAYHPDIVSLVERLMGEKPKLIQDMALLKPPFGGGEKPWHQDMAYGGLTYGKPVVGVWIALDEAGVENGCMQVIPRSHMDGGIPHYAVRDWQICDANVPVERNVIVPLKPGGALFFHGQLVHGTAYNFSDKRRRALQFHYAPATAEKVSPQEYKRMYTNEMSGAEC
ncbi:phytanoyl-CoA dioxygenase family protein [Paenibacillus sp. MBLB4367]|uniref:phytanoyl-CoA dioxygenase family protein n=1 Tax=Paenibacillus sp. MBLB4367 TaxID=3384767 RepID=UPI0039083F60